MKGKCIICREYKDSFTDEHVIPDSLGGYYHIYTVCGVCNSNLGDKVDSPLVNHKLSELYRFAQSIAGKSGKIPNPFSGTFTQDKDPNKKGRMDLQSDGNLKLYFPPEVRIVEKDGQITAIQIAVDETDVKNLDKIADKVLARKDIPREAVVRGDRMVEIDTNRYSMSWALDVDRFKIGLLKIAYEFAVDTIPSYFEDPGAVEISKILMGAKYDEVEKYVNIGNGLQDEVMLPYQGFLDFSSKSHYLALSDGGDLGLVGVVKLHDLFAVGVTLSKNKHLGEGLFHIGVNSLEDRTFRKFTSFELMAQCMGPLECQFLFASHDELRRSGPIEDTRSPHFSYEGKKNQHTPIYNASGIHVCYLKDLVVSSACKVAQTNLEFVQKSKFNPLQCYYIKEIGTGKMYRVVGHEVVTRIIKKL